MRATGAEVSPREAAVAFVAAAECPPVKTARPSKALLDTACKDRSVVGGGSADAAARSASASIDSSAGPVPHVGVFSMANRARSGSRIDEGAFLEAEFQVLYDTSSIYRKIWSIMQEFDE